MSSYLPCLMCCVLRCCAVSDCGCAQDDSVCPRESELRAQGVASRNNNRHRDRYLDIYHKTDIITCLSRPDLGRDAVV